MKLLTLLFTWIYNIFKSKQSFLLDPKGTSKVIKQVSEEFNYTSVSLLEQANELLSNLEDNTQELEDKAKLLLECGFKNQQLVKDIENLKRDKAAKEKKANWLRLAKEKYPTHKYIPHNELDTILKRYGMILGKVEDFKGYVPKVNLEDIKKFFEVYPDLKYTYNSRMVSKDTGYSSGWSQITEREYNRKYKELYPEFVKEGEPKPYISSYVSRYADEIQKVNSDLYICAFKYEFDDSKVRQDASQPIVLINTREFCDSYVTAEKGGYIIITAWGGDLQYEPAIYNDVELV